jgi:hypothetical protein
MSDEGITQRWYGLTSRQYLKISTETSDRRPAVHETAPHGERE